MRILVIAAAAVVATACSPRDNLASDRTLTQSPEAAVHGEPTVTGGAYDSIIHRVGRERGLPAAGAHGAAQPGHAPAAAAGDSAAPDTVASDSAPPHQGGDSAAQGTGGGATH